MEKYFHGVLCVFIITFAFTHVGAQDQNGFITLDCGLLPDGSPYTNPSTGLTFTSDSSFIESGKNGRVSKDSERNFEKAFITLRYFPDGERNCYSLKVTQGTNYLIRASFLYGNYDGLHTIPNFDLFIGPNKWTTVNFNGSGGGLFEEMIHMSRSSSLHICLVKTGTTTPMISTLELRPLRSDTYISANGSSLQLFFRGYLDDSVPVLRYPDDVYDRRWFPFTNKEWTLVTTTLNVNTTNGFDLPQGAMASAATRENDNGTWEFPWSLKDSTTRFHIYLHFAELETLLANETREFNVLLNGKVFYGPYSPTSLSIGTMSTQPESTLTCKGGSCLLQLVKTTKSTLPPLINAIELFTVVEFPQSETNQDEVSAIKKIQIAYGLSRINWQGDPCVPEQFLWAGLKCNNTDSSNPPTVTFLNLSSSGLTGMIASSIQNLTHLQELDLSNNDLVGGVPEFLADIKSLLIINLRGNNFSGLLPQKLLQKKGLKLNVEGNHRLICTEGPCVNKPGEGGHPKKSIIVPVVSSVALIAVLVAALILFFVLKNKNSSRSKANNRTSRSSEPPRITRKKRFTYAEVIEMTNNFESVLGKGGFAMVYHGYVNGTEPVAVKVLSHASNHGHKQFKAEVELLLRVHHKNLVNLVGYCEKGKELALVYEYMANGDLKEFFSGKRGDAILRWETRLQIALEAAQGLEYLHKGCKPPIIHRDVKTANILLDEHFRAKLADFGLSRSLLNEGESHVSTVVAGTIGYLDPEYYRTNRLTEMSDVYSFGVVLLEIITNRPVIEQSREKPHIAEWVNLMIIVGDIRKIVDPSLKKDYHSDSVWKFVELAMTCVNASSMARPTMSQVVTELTDCIKLEYSMGGKSHNMGSESSRDVTMIFDTEVNPVAR
ncbi:PREDICTED: receptor-like protein kinase At3g21340 [Camelina sativa]|uniref:non-specific serine/threonine protein kinase n=1 Tax=Camelina sativa TaxID=90675 RepID=A0ABM0YG97_CAMSA|nr:PREDICTED: receptor-like protein kinase At3g21340 [Camelina sativa]